MADLGFDIATQLAGASIGLTLGANVFDGPEIPASGLVALKAVFCLTTGGAAPQAYMDGGASEERFPKCQIMVRGTAGRGNFADGQTLARAVRTAVHRASISGYTDVFVQESEPNFLGFDKDEVPRWSVNVVAWLDE